MASTTEFEKPSNNEELIYINVIILIKNQLFSSNQ
jgi:hypothetical protein